MIEAAVELAGLGVGRGVALAAAAVDVPRTILGGRHRRDPDVGRLAALPFDEMHPLAAPDGGELFTTACGEGPPLLFVHGFAMTSRVWTKQFRELPAAGLRAVAFDHRGHGASSASMHDPTIDRLADDVRSVVEGLDLHDAVLVGHSLGGMALLGFAVGFPEVVAARVRGLVLVSTTARLGLAAFPLVSGAAVPFTAGFVRSGTWARSDWTRLVARSLFGTDPVPSQVELARVLLASARDETFVACARAGSTFDLRAHLREVAVPTVVVNGTADLLTTPGDARRLARGIPHARLELVPGAGHMVMLERAAHFDALLCGFARELGVASGLAA